MSDFDLRPFASRYRALVDSSPPETLAETRAWIVAPLLESIGWNGTDESRRTDVVVDETQFEYVCLVESVPVLFVAVDPFASSLDRDRAASIYRTMAWTGVDRAIYTNGREVLLLAGTSDVEHFRFRLSAIDDHESAFAHFARDGLERRLERHERDHVARQLALERDALADTVVDALTDATDDTYEREFAAETDRFLDTLVASFTSGDSALPASADERAEDGVSIRFTDPTASATDAMEPTDAAEPDGTAERPSTAGGDAGESRTDGETVDETEETAFDEEPDGEYVVRFFAERGSVGAIGHSTSTRALVHAAEYCLDRGLGGVSVPWSPSDHDGTVLNDEPTHADGTPMETAERLSNGLYLNVGGSVADRATRVEELATRSGLRAMLTGDWDRDR